MTLKSYAVTLAAPDGSTRTVTVPSPTEVQAGDAARPLMKGGETLVSIAEVDAEDARLDGGAPNSQAAEFAPVTPGMAAASDAASSKDHDRG